ncbi:TPA: hypothetical protein HA251_01585 [Candidatus Woesearchaeota archaeon]|nr:hypothetical protein [Candidatus Woesearchaeota archaeon]
MEMNDPSLDDCVDWAHAQIQSRLGVSFPRPLLIIGDEEIKARMQCGSRRDVARVLPEMMYDDVSGAIIVPDSYLSSAGEINPSRRRYVLLHEIAHALTTHVNPILNEERITSLLNSDLRRQRVGYSLYSFVEGIADGIAVGVAHASEDAALHACADEVHGARVDYFVRWLDAYFAPYRKLRSSIDMCRRTGVLPLPQSVDMVAASPSDPLSCALSILDRCPGVVAANNAHYAVGYDFVRKVGVDPIALMRKPPTSFKELLYPETYAKW